MPKIPFQLDGMRIEPPSSPPRAIDERRAAIAAPDPPDEPPQVRLRSHGFRHGPKAMGSVTIPPLNSGVLVFPRTMKPADLSLVTTAWSRSGTRSFHAPDPYVDRIPAVSTTSLSTTGMPWNGGSSEPLIFDSASLASASVESAATVIIEPTD